MKLTNCERDTCIHAVSTLLCDYQSTCDMLGWKYDDALIKYYQDILYKLECDYDV